MAAPTYATPTMLAAWMGLFLQDGVTGDPTKLPTGAAGALRSACNAVREATVTWFFFTDPTTGLPTDTDLAESLANATCYQAVSLITAAVDPNAGGTLDATVESSVAAGSVRITVAGADQAAASRSATILGLCPEARRELRLVTGIRKGAWVVG